MRRGLAPTGPRDPSRAPERVGSRRPRHSGARPINARGRGDRAAARAALDSIPAGSSRGNGASGPPGGRGRGQEVARRRRGVRVVAAPDSAPPGPRGEGRVPVAGARPRARAAQGLRRSPRRRHKLLAGLGHRSPGTQRPARPRRGPATVDEARPELPGARGTEGAAAWQRRAHRRPRRRPRRPPRTGHEPRRAGRPPGGGGGEAGRGRARGQVQEPAGEARRRPRYEELPGGLAAGKGLRDRWTAGRPPRWPRRRALGAT